MLRNSVSTQPTFASLNALGPSVIKICVISIPTVLEPSTPASATTGCAVFPGTPALGATVNAATHGWTRLRGGVWERMRECNNARDTA